MAWNEETDAILRRMWPEHTAAEIGEELGVSPNAVIGRANRIGCPSKKRMRVKPRTSPKLKYRWTPAMDARVREMWPGSRTQEVIAREVGVSPWALASRARELGLPKRDHMNRKKRKPVPAAPWLDRQQKPTPTQQGWNWHPSEADKAPPSLPPEPDDAELQDRPPNPGHRFCQQIYGHPATGRYAWCGEPVEPGRPYCAAHCARHYRGYWHGEEDAA